MAMKSPPGSISPPAGCRDSLQIDPELGFEVTALQDVFSGKIMATPTFLGFMGFYRLRRGPRRCLGGRGGSHPSLLVGLWQGAVPGPWVAPQVPLRSSGVFRPIKNLCKF